MPKIMLIQVFGANVHIRMGFFVVVVCLEEGWGRGDRYTILMRRMDRPL